MKLSAAILPFLFCSVISYRGLSDCSADGTCTAEVPVGQDKGVSDATFERVVVFRSESLDAWFSALQAKLVNSSAGVRDVSLRLYQCVADPELPVARAAATSESWEQFAQQRCVQVGRDRSRTEMVLALNTLAQSVVLTGVLATISRFTMGLAFALPGVIMGKASALATNNKDPNTVALVAGIFSSVLGSVFFGPVQSQGTLSVQQLRFLGYLLEECGQFTKPYSGRVITPSIGVLRALQEIFRS